jgi:class 3 adenylate cyclase/CheY-like chemotaxis protein
MPKIVIVDDEVENLNSLKRFLEGASLGWNIYTAQSEREFETVMKVQNPDVVISDLVMASEQSGMEILRQAKQKDPLVMVILVTAFEKKLDRYRAFDLGAFDCVQKNMPGVIAAEEILVKTKAALRFRELALHQIESEKRIMFLKRYFDPRVFVTIERNPELLSIHSQTLTICFWDIRGFSKLCETLKAHPTLISGFLREFSKTASEVIFEHNGVLDKFIGDGVMGLFGVLNQKDDKGHQDAVDAVSAAISLKKRFEELLEIWMKEWKLYTPETIDIGLGCGIHTGETLVGNIGTEIRDHFTAIGPHVNFAKRIESRSGKGQILVSASTEVRIRDHFELTKIETLSDVKNVPGKFDIFEVIRSKR